MLWKRRKSAFLHWDLRTSYGLSCESYCPPMSLGVETVTFQLFGSISTTMSMISFSWFQWLVGISGSGPFHSTRRIRTFSRSAGGPGVLVLTSGVLRDSYMTAIDLPYFYHRPTIYLLYASYMLSIRFL